MEMVKEKSRKLSIYEFFEILQLEWLVADLRLRLYERKKDRDYWKKVRDCKQIKIEEIADKNGLPTIFNDSGFKTALEKKIYRQSSYPLFFYKNEEQKATQEYWDLYYYYFRDADVRCDIGEETKVGKIKSFQPFDAHVLVTLNDGTEQKIQIVNVTRIL